jgi:hypothetical protein
MTFRKYVYGLRLTHDAERSAFIRQVRSDKAMPELNDWDELKAHLQSMGASTDSLHQARVIWLNYQWAATRTKPRRFGLIYWLTWPKVSSKRRRIRSLVSVSTTSAVVVGGGTQQLVAESVNDPTYYCHGSRLSQVQAIPLKERGLCRRKP